MNESKKRVREFDSETGLRPGKYSADTLRPQEKEWFVSQVIDGNFSYDYILEKYNLPKSTVKSWVKRKKYVLLFHAHIFFSPI